MNLVGIRCNFCALQVSPFLTGADQQRSGGNPHVLTIMPFSSSLLVNYPSRSLYLLYSHHHLAEGGPTNLPLSWCWPAGPDSQAWRTRSSWETLGKMQSIAKNWTILRGTLLVDRPTQLICVWMFATIQKQRDGRAVCQRPTCQGSGESGVPQTLGAVVESRHTG